MNINTLLNGVSSFLSENVSEFNFKATLVLECKGEKKEIKINQTIYTIFSLYEDLMYNILDYMSIKDCLCMYRVSKMFNEQYKNYWKYKFYQIFPYDYNNEYKLSDNYIINFINWIKYIEFNDYTNLVNLQICNIINKLNTMTFKVYENIDLCLYMIKQGKYKNHDIISTAEYVDNVYIKNDNLTGHLEMKKYNVKYQYNHDCVYTAIKHSSFKIVRYYVEDNVGLLKRRDIFEELLWRDDLIDYNLDFNYDNFCVLRIHAYKYLSYSFTYKDNNIVVTNLKYIIKSLTKNNKISLFLWSCKKAYVLPINTLWNEMPIKIRARGITHMKNNKTCRIYKNYNELMDI